MNGAMRDLPSSELLRTIIPSIFTKTILVLPNATAVLGKMERLDKLLRPEIYDKQTFS